MAETKKEKAAKERSLRLKVTDFIFDAYGVGFLSKRFYVKLDSVYNGTYPGLRKPIPMEDVLDMWRLYKPNLDRIDARNRTRGKIMTSEQRINYDLAVLLSQYERYLVYKERQQRAQSLAQDQEQNDKLFSAASKVGASSPTKQNEDLNIDSMLNEI